MDLRQTLDLDAYLLCNYIKTSVIWFYVSEGNIVCQAYVMCKVFNLQWTLNVAVSSQCVKCSFWWSGSVYGSGSVWRNGNVCRSGSVCWSVSCCSESRDRHVVFVVCRAFAGARATTWTLKNFVCSFQLGNPCFQGHDLQLLAQLCVFVLQTFCMLGHCRRIKRERWFRGHYFWSEVIEN